MENSRDYNQNQLHKTQFFIKLYYCQHATWQGEVTWLDATGKKQSLRFRSQKELLKLMDEAVEISEKPEAEYKLRSWEKEETAARLKGT